MAKQEKAPKAPKAEGENTEVKSAEIVEKAPAKVVAAVTVESAREKANELIAQLDDLISQKVKAQKSSDRFHYAKITIGRLLAQNIIE